MSTFVWNGRTLLVTRWYHMSVLTLKLPSLSKGRMLSPNCIRMTRVFYFVSKRSMFHNGDNYLQDRHLDSNSHAKPLHVYICHDNFLRISDLCKFLISLAVIISCSAERVASHIRIVKKKYTEVSQRRCTSGSVSLWVRRYTLSLKLDEIVDRLPTQSAALKKHCNCNA
jgi:hypothetical protein